MKERAIIGFISLVTCLLIIVTLADVIWTNDSINMDKGVTTIDGTGGSETGTSENSDDGEGNSDDNQNGESGGNSSGIIINPEGMSLETRISTPNGFIRTVEEENSLGAFIRNYGVKENGARVLLYDGSEKDNQAAHVAVFTLPIENRNLQQCADSVMRMYAEYFLSTKQYDRIAFHYSDGFEASYSKWITGYKIKVTNDKAKWVKDATCDDSYESFIEYMRLVFAYAGTYSMMSEADDIDISDIKIGDIFIKGGSPGHVVMVVDTCVDENGKKAFLLAQGFMPAQEFHVLNNPLHFDDPWYYVDEVIYPLDTPEYSFGEGTLKRLRY